MTMTDGGFGQHAASDGCHERTLAGPPVGARRVDFPGPSPSGAKRSEVLRRYRRWRTRAATMWTPFVQRQATPHHLFTRCWLRRHEARLCRPQSSRRSLVRAAWNRAPHRAATSTGPTVGDVASCRTRFRSHRSPVCKAARRLCIRSVQCYGHHTIAKGRDRTSVCTTGRRRPPRLFPGLAAKGVPRPGFAHHDARFRCIERRWPRRAQSAVHCDQRRRLPRPRAAEPAHAPFDEARDVHRSV